MFNNQRIKELEEKIKTLEIIIASLEEYKDNRIFRERNLKYVIKNEILRDINFINTLENAIINEVTHKLQSNNSEDIIVRSNRIRLDKIKDVLNTITGFDWEYKKVEHGTSIYYKFYALKHHSDFSISVHELRNEYSKTLKSIVDYALREELKDV